MRDLSETESIAVDQYELEFVFSRALICFSNISPPNTELLCIKNLQMDFSFQENKTVCKSITWFTSYINSPYTGEFKRCFFLNLEYSLNLVIWLLNFGAVNLSPWKVLFGRLSFLSLVW